MDHMIDLSRLAAANLCLHVGHTPPTLTTEFLETL
jgi:hypothetical protein